MNLENSILVTLLLKELGVQRVVAKAINTLQQRVLRRIGADMVVFPEEESGYEVAHNLVYPAINAFIDLGEDFLILQMTTRPDWVGRSLADLNLAGQASADPRPGYSGLQVQVLRRDHRLICQPRPDERLQAGDVLAVLGTHRDLERLLG